MSQGIYYTWVALEEKRTVMLFVSWGISNLSWQFTGPPYNTIFQETIPESQRGLAYVDKATRRGTDQALECLGYILTECLCLQGDDQRLALPGLPNCWERDGDP